MGRSFSDGAWKENQSEQYLGNGLIKCLGPATQNDHKPQEMQPPKDVLCVRGSYIVPSLLLAQEPDWTKGGMNRMSLCPTDLYLPLSTQYKAALGPGNTKILLVHGEGEVRETWFRSLLNSEGGLLALER